MEKKMDAISAAAFLALALCAHGADFHDWAKTPPMGWNSWDCFGTTLTEAQSREQADMQAKYLLPAGYKYHTVDIQWYEPDSVRHWYKEGAKLEMDGYGRLLPAVKKFPSAAGGKGFKPLADYVHSKGLKFAIHMMRGIPRQAVDQNTPVLGTKFHAKDIANVNDKCAWNPDKYGVDMAKPGAQEYYDSVFAQYAAWGVDFVKVDDIARPYSEAQRLEIEAIRKAIDRTGRPIVLSLSPGDTPLSRGAHVCEYANMWRVCDDFWDRWEPLHGLFGRLHKWTEFRRAGSWPDADMLPFGVVDFGRKTRLTEAEQRTCMTLDCIARSPLIFGGDMTKLDKFTLDLLTNTAVVAINQASENNRQLWRKGDHVAWTADVPGSKDKYVAVFNAETEGDVDGRRVPAEAEIAVDLKEIGFTGPVAATELWTGRTLNLSEPVLRQSVKCHDCAVFRISPAR